MLLKITWKMLQKYAKMFYKINNQEVEMKSYAESKTLWVSIITGLLGSYPPAQEIMKADPQLVISGVALVFAVLRYFTSKKLGK